MSRRSVVPALVALFIASLVVLALHRLVGLAFWPPVLFMAGGLALSCLIVWRRQRAGL